MGQNLLLEKHQKVYLVDQVSPFQKKLVRSDFRKEKKIRFSKAFQIFKFCPVFSNDVSQWYSKQTKYRIHLREPGAMPLTCVTLKNRDPPINFLHRCYLKHLPTGNACCTYMHTAYTHTRTRSSHNTNVMHVTRRTHRQITDKHK